MQLMIEIPDDYIKVVMANQRTEGTAMDKLLRQAVIDGEPLPKGHGRLGDLDSLSKKFIKKDVEDFDESLEALAGWFLRTCNHEDTIIEADTESEE